MQSTKLLRRALAANATFSALSGLVLTIITSQVADWLGVSITGWLRLFGLVLIGHAIVLAWVLTRPDVRRWGQLNLLAIAPYPLIMLALVLTGLVDGSLGQGLVIFDGLVIAAIAVGHALGLRNETTEVHPQ